MCITIISKLLALDLISAHQIVHCEFLEKGLTDAGFMAPKSVNNVMKLLQCQADKIREQYIAEFAKQINENKRFSYTADENTSKRNRRYAKLI